MPLAAVRFTQLIVEHVMARLQADLPPSLRLGIGEHLPGLLNQLPFLSVVALTKRTHNSGLGGTVALKRTVIDGTPVDLGYVTGELGEGEFTLTLWALTRPQLEEVRNALAALTWLRRPHEREAPVGTLTRTTLLRCHLSDLSPALVAPLAPPPPSLTVNANNTDLRSAPAGDAPVVGQASAGQPFELLGRSADSAFVQGCCFNGQPIWLATAAVTLPLPIGNLPIIPAPVAAPVATPVASRPARRRAPVAAIDPGTAILATATTPVLTAWRQDLRYTAQLEVTQEPLTSAGELIQELHITQQMAVGEQMVQRQRIRLGKTTEAVVDNF